ncbi:MAG: hypothetical protein FD123_3424 [Bacteroidetes bacterium]|nr:MAG: hypothetical protein FD123_3424 [Bacteroidota bacterium]
MKAIARPFEKNKKRIVAGLSLFLVFLVIRGDLKSQPIVNNWSMNNTVMAKYYLQSGQPPNFTYTLTTMTDLADVQLVCYTTDSVWVQTTGLAQIMGPYLNPGSPTNQNKVWRFPRNPQAASVPVEVPNVFSTGVLLNGVSIFGNGDATSYDPQSNSNANNGAGLWNVDAWYGEGFTLDTMYGAHVNQTGAYHTHATPFQMYSDDSTQHSPLVGFAFDGYPVYGPFGYSTATNSSSGTRRMKTSFRLRSITQRTILPDGSTSTPPGPNVSGTFPLGMYIEDYEYVSALGDLDDHNGRYCVTPEYPGGTYAYFVAIDPNGDPAYPYYFGTTFYGEVVTDDLNPTGTISMPSSPTGCVSPAGVQELPSFSFEVFPNPSYGTMFITIKLETVSKIDAVVIDALGRTVYSANVQNTVHEMDLSALAPGIYMLRVTDRETGESSVQEIIKY